MSIALATAPPFGQIMAAYRPIFMKVRVGVGDSVEVVYADVYFNGALYQTVHTTAGTIYSELTVNPGGINVTSWYKGFEFDFQRVCQDFLRSRLPSNIAGTTMDFDAGGASKMQVRFRIGVQTAGLLNVSIVAQAVSNEVLVVNAAVPHDSVPVLRDYLNQFKPAIWNIGKLRLLPLSGRPAGSCFASPEQHEHYPFIAEWNGLVNTNNAVSSAYLVIKVQYKGSEQIYASHSDYNQAAGRFTINPFAVNYLPLGIPQLRLLPWELDNAPSWHYVAKWRIELIYDGSTALVTPWMVVPEVGCDEAPRVRFLNRLGAYDSINFQEATLESDTTSSSFQSAVKQIPAVGGLRVRGRQRYNVRTGHRLTAVTTLYPESAQDWLSQLIDSPDVYIERPALPGRPADFVPVVVEDAKAVLRKTEERYEYEQTVVFRYANDTPRQRM